MNEILTPAQTVSRTYLRSFINEEDCLRFRNALKTFLANFDEQGKEEYNKTLVRDFLKEAFYNKTNAINTYGDADSAIYGTVHAKGSVPLVLIEAKSRRSADMIDLMHFNRKALHELVYTDKLMTATRITDQEGYERIYEELNAFVEELYGIKLNK